MTKRNEVETLQKLAAELTAIVDGGLETEVQISKITGVDQPTISNAKRGKLKRVTDRIQPLLSYTYKKLSTQTRRSKTTELTQRFFEAGGTEAEFAASIEHAIALLTRKQRH